MAEGNAQIKFTFVTEELNEYLERVRIALEEMRKEADKFDQNMKKLKEAVKDADRATANLRDASRKAQQGRTW